MHYCLVLGYGSGRAEVLTWNTQNNSDSRDTHTYKSACSTSTTKIELGNNLAPTTDNVWLQVDFNFTPNRMRTPSIDAASYYTCRTLCSVVYMLVRLMDCANTAEPIDMLFGGEQTQMGKKHHVLDGDLDLSTGRASFERKRVRACCSVPTDK